MRLKRVLISFLVVTSSFAAFCLKDKEGVSSSHGEKVTITIISGNNQMGQGGRILAEPIVVQAMDSHDQPVENCPVLFEICEGSGTIIDQPTVRTDEQGIAIYEYLNGIESYVRAEKFGFDPVMLVLGDADGDGDVDVFDWVKVRRIVMGFDEETPGADADGDSDVDILDWLEVRMIILGLD